MRIRSLFLVGLLMATAPTAATASNNRLDEVLANMERQARATKTIFARLKQEKRYRQIGGGDSYTGNFLFKHGSKGDDRVRIDYDNGQIVAVVGEKITLYQPNIKQAFVTTRKAQAGRNQEFAFIATPYASVPGLKRDYNVAYIKEESTGESMTAVLELTPKGKSAARKVTLWVDKSLWLPTKYQVVESNGDVSTFTLSSIKINTAIANSSFDVKLPSGTKVVRQ